MSQRNVLRLTLIGRGASCMKRITAIVRPEKLEPLKQALFAYLLPTYRG